MKFRPAKSVRLKKPWKSESMPINFNSFVSSADAFSSLPARILVLVCPGMVEQMVVRLGHSALLCAVAAGLRHHYSRFREVFAL